MRTIRKIFNRFSSPSVNYQPLIEVRIFKDAILHNLHVFQKKYPALQFAPVLKSNAYGHGLVGVATILDNQRAPFFMVDSFYEALVLRRAGIKTKILILGYNRTEQVLNNKLKECSFGIISFEQLKIISTKLTKRQAFHLKIDTGMHRQGIMPEEIDEAIKLIKANKNFVLEGICTHLADADGADSTGTERQISIWNKSVNIFRKEFSEIKYFHASATAGTHYADKIDANVSRLGIGLYGINPSPFEQIDLHPAMEMVSVISSIKKITPGEKVGYGGTFISSAPTIVATVPVGYNEGVGRRLSNKGYFKIGDIFCPLAGRVSMNMSSIDVTQVPQIKLEDEVIVISANQNDKNSVENIAKICECIPYEVLVHVPQHLRRTVV